MYAFMLPVHILHYYDQYDNKKTRPLKFIDRLEPAERMRRCAKQRCHGELVIQQSVCHLWLGLMASGGRLARKADVCHSHHV